MNIGLKHFQAFVAVAGNLHFGRAAAEINVSQPTLSLLIQQIEDVVGTKLFTRSTRQVELTDMGREFLPWATGVVNDLLSAVEHMRDFVELKKGRVTVAAFPSVAVNLLPEIMVEFRESHPNVSVKIIDGATDVVMGNVGSGVADFAVGGCPDSDGKLDFVPIYNEDIKLLLKREHRLASSKSVAWRQIIDEEIITVSKETGIRQLIDESLAKMNMKLNAILEPSMIQTVLSMTAAGVGPGVVLSSYLPMVSDMDLVALPLTKPNIVRSVGTITREGHQLTPAAEALHDLIVKRLGETENGLSAVLSGS